MENRLQDSTEKTLTDEMGKSLGVQDNKYLSFNLGGEEYGIEILKVKEIIGMMNITSVPQTPEYVMGVINLRGKVIPIISLRLKFGMEFKDYDDQTCIIVVDIGGAGAKGLIMGLIVDSVVEVLNIRESEIEDTPSFGVKLNTEYILGMAKLKGGIKILLDIEKVIDNSGLTELAALQQQSVQ